MNTEADFVLKNNILDMIFKTAEEHGMDSCDLDHEIGDLQDLLFPLMRILSLKKVGSLIGESTSFNALIDTSSDFKKFEIKKRTDLLALLDDAVREDDIDCVKECYISLLNYTASESVSQESESSEVGVYHDIITHIIYEYMDNAALLTFLKSEEVYEFIDSHGCPEALNELIEEIPTQAI